MQKLRPLWWWVILVIVLFAIHDHQIWLDRTRLVFSVTLEGQPLPFEPIVTLDGRPIRSGERISLGSHRFVIDHPKVEPFSTDLFIWYGEHNLDFISLKRATGTLAIQAHPPAARITIRGPDFTATLTNTTGGTLSVPTDRYMVAAEYPHWRESGEVNVSMNVTDSWNFAPRLGTARLTCNRPGASFQVFKADNGLVEAGDFPETVQDLPQGSYRLVAWRNGDRREDTLTVTAGATNRMEVQFRYGTVVLETEPPGATVVTENGREWGTTPLTFREITPGRWQFTLRLAGYSAVTAVVDITAEQTNIFHTNLLSINFVRAMESARQYLASADYERALAAANDALQANPNDADATVLQKEATCKRLVRAAESLAKQRDYIGADRELELALQSVPENAEAQQLLTDFKKREPEQVERLKAERLERPKNVFDSIHFNGAGLFDSHELTTSKPAGEVRSAIVTQLKSVQPSFQIIRSDMTNEIFRIEATQEFSGGARHCLIVGGQTKDDETRIFFKVIESKKVGFFEQPITSLVGATPPEYTVINPTQPLNDKSKNQIADGVRIVTERIQHATGQ